MERSRTFRFAAVAHVLRQAAMLAGVIAVAALLSACSDNPDKLTAPTSLRLGNTTSGTYGNGQGNAAKVIVCVDASSPAGIYKFRNSSWNSGLSLLPGYGALDGGTWYDQGDGGEGYGAAGGTTTWSPAENDNSEYAVGVGQCVVVLNRVAPSDHYWTNGIDDWQAVNVSSTTIPTGIMYDHTDCNLDLGVLTTQPNPCGTSGITTRAFANYNHGSKLTFVFAVRPAAPPACALGYPDNSTARSSIAFNESEVLSAFGRGDGQIRAWYTDEHALTLGVRQLFVDNKTGADVTTNYTIAVMSGNPASATGNPVAYGSTVTSGEGAAVDPAGRPLFPAMFVTDLTLNGMSSRVGDWQQGGAALASNALYGTWKGAVEKVNKTVSPAVTTITTDADPKVNHLNVGAGGINPPLGVSDQGYSTEIVWNVANIPGYDPTHTYRVQFMVHDGDQNKAGGDVGQACINIGPGTPDNWAKMKN
jgi:hypothetical protein